MASMYSRFGTDSGAHLRNLILGALSDKDQTDAPASSGIMSRSSAPPEQLTSRFSGMSSPEAVIKPSTEDRGNTYLERFATMLGMASDDPEAVANAVLPREDQGMPDMSEWDNLPPPPGSRSQTRQALGTAPDTTNRGEGTFNLEEALDTVMANEGGFQQLRRDRGNYVGNRLIGTNFGVTPAALADYRGVEPESITVADMRNLTEEEARQIFLDDYYFKPGLDRLPQELQANVFDMYVNSGRNAIRILQDMAGVEEDGVLGPETLEAVRNAGITNDMYAQRRIEYYNRLARNDPSQRGFLQGWLNRARKYFEG